LDFGLLWQLLAKPVLKKDVVSSFCLPFGLEISALDQHTRDKKDVIVIDHHS
jgi:hypothetical protein